MRSFVSSRALVASLVAVVAGLGCGGGGGDDTPPADTTPPALVSVTPADAATGVAASATVGATFSEPLACATVTAASFSVTGDGVLAGSLACAGATVTFTPAVPLQRGRVHAARITTAVTDLAGNHLGAQVDWTFTVVPADTTPPTVLSTVPAGGATGVSLGTEIRVNLSEPVDCATAGAFSLAAEGPVPGLVGCQGAVVTFTPSAGLAPSTTYTATLSTGLEDLAGNPLAAPYVYTFTTGVPPDVTRPTVVSTVPAAGGLGVALDGALSATFSEAMDPATIGAASFTLRTGGADVAGSVGYAGLIATFTPSAPLAASTVYTATITTAVTDLAGNALGAPASWTFTTADAPGGVRVVYERNGDLFSVREDGTGTVQLTNTFLSSETFGGVGPGGQVLYVTTGGMLQAVPAGGPVSPVTLAGPTPGLQVRGITSTGRAVYAAGGHLYSVTLDGLTTAQLWAEAGATEEDVHFAPDGRVVFRSVVGGDIHVGSAADDGSGRLLLDHTAGIKTIPFVAPSGRVYIERVVGYGDQHDLWSVEADGSLLAPVVNDPNRWEAFQAIAPDGTLIYSYSDIRVFYPRDEHVVVSGADVSCGYGGYEGVTTANRVIYQAGDAYENLALRSMTTAGADDLPLEVQVGGMSHVLVHPGGRVLYRKFDGTQGDVRCVDSATGTLTVLLSSPADEFPLGMAPGGRLIYGAVDPNSGGFTSLHSVDAACGDHRLLVQSATGSIALQGFTSTGKVAFTLSTPPNGIDLYLVGHDDSAPVNLTKNPSKGTTTFFSSVP